MRQYDLEQLKRKLPSGTFSTYILYNSPVSPFNGLPKDLGWHLYEVLSAWNELVHKGEIEVLCSDGTDHFIAKVRR